MATPLVSGVAALLLSEKGLSASQARSTLKSTAQGSGGCNSIGVVNLASALGSSSGSTTEPAPVGSGAIAGTVTSGTGKNKKPVSGGTVDCGSGGKATTASDGTYDIASVPASTHTCTASASGFTSKSSSVTVEDGKTTTANFGLR